MDKRSSYAEFSSQLKERNIVVIEIGRHYTKCGFAGEPAPRAIIKSTIKDKNNRSIYLHSMIDPEELQSSLGDFVEKIYFNHLAVSPKEKNVVVVESVFCKSIFRNALTRVFFEQFNVPAILFVPDHLVALVTLGISNGLIIDIGSSEAISIAVVDGVTLLDGAQFANLGADTLDLLISDELSKANRHIGSFNRSTIEDIRVKTCFVAPFERGLKLTKNKLHISKQIQSEALRAAGEQGLQVSMGSLDDCYFLGAMDEDSPAALNYPFDGHKVVKVPGNLREGVSEIFFEIIGHEHSLTTMIVETILSAPIDCRRVLAANILVIGGMANMPGIEHRLYDELSHLDEYERFKRKVPDKFLFHKPICPRNYVSWLGASMFCTTNSFELRATNREQWLRDGKKNLRDWTDLNR